MLHLIIEGHLHGRHPCNQPCLTNSCCFSVLKTRRQTSFQRCSQADSRIQSARQSASSRLENMYETFVNGFQDLINQLVDWFQTSDVHG